MLTTLAFAVMAVTGLAQIATIATVAVRFRREPRKPAFDGPPPFVSIVRPICGVENNLQDCLDSSFTLDYPDYEVIFCADEPDDAAIPLARRAMAAHPEIPSSLVIGRDTISINPKLNNCVKGWRAAKSDWVILSDSNCILTPDYLDRLWSRWDENTGCVSMAASVGRPEGFASDLECAFVNSLQARLVLAADSLGFGYALGKTLMYHKPTVEKLGGIGRLAEQTAEDIATTHLMREARLDIHLAQFPVLQPIGRRSFRAVLQRQIRWARLRRSGLKGIYAAEALNGGALPIACGIGLAAAGAMPGLAVAAFALLWYGLELGLIRVAGWSTSWRMPAALVLRDVFVPIVWIAGMFGSRFEWRGNAMTVAVAPDDGSALEAEAAKR